MATQGPGLTAFDPKKESHVPIELELVLDSQSGKEKFKIKDRKEPFWVSQTKKEVVEWFCKRNDVEKAHVHGKNSPCFTVIFDKDGNPFTGDGKFASDSNGYAQSTNVKPEVTASDRIYHYHVLMDGMEPLDPGGGVKP